jgi:predicted NAD-dependent protein-ADP-ribosyltransferase YbiA (DUF1768 family)
MPSRNTEYSHLELSQSAFPVDADTLRNPQPASLNVIASNPESCLLSNFARAPFILDGVEYQSTEGFIQAIKFPPDSALRERASNSIGAHARKLGVIHRRLNSKKFEDSSVVIYYGGKELAYGSDGHLQIIESAIRAKFEQNLDVLSSLLATANRPLYHDTGRKEGKHTSLPAKKFIAILESIRSEELAKLAL